MFKRVLIAEDHESISFSVKQTLNEIGVINPDYVAYCDHALSWIKKGINTVQPYDLLITDLSFDDDQSKQQIIDGISLIKAVRDIQPDLAILVFSAEGRSEILAYLKNDVNINAFVRKARHDSKELMAAFKAIAEGNTYFPSMPKRTSGLSNSFDFTEYDILIIAQLVERKQNQIPEYLKMNNVRPSSLSSVEKRLSYIKDCLGFSTNEQLIVYCKSLDII